MKPWSGFVGMVTVVGAGIGDRWGLWKVTLVGDRDPYPSNT